MTASFPRVERTVSLTLPLSMKKTASAGSPWEKTTCLFRYSRVVLPFSILDEEGVGVEGEGHALPRDLPRSGLDSHRTH